MREFGQGLGEGGGAMKNVKGLIGVLAVLVGLAFSGFAIAYNGAGGHGGGGHGGGGHGGVGGGHGGHGGGYGGHYGNRGGFYGYGWSGAYLGGPWFWGAYDTWPLYDGNYYPPEAATLTPTYPEQEVPADAPQRGETAWYYCGNPPGYYPYVQNCPSGWQRVQPQLPPGRYWGCFTSNTGGAMQQFVNPRFTGELFVELIVSAAGVE
jgi:hypothetical protein